MATFEQAMSARRARRPHWDGGVVAIRRKDVPNSHPHQYLRGLPNLGPDFMTETNFWIPTHDDITALDWEIV